MHDIVPLLVDITQAGYVKGRLMSDSVRTLIDIVEYCQINKENGVMMMVDFTKAFDSLQWSFLFKTLKSMNFGVSFLKWIQVLYTNVESCIFNNGKTSKYFKLHRGVRQGDPLSAYLFILCMEVLSRRIMNNNNIEGIVIKNHHYKLVQYADDVTVILKNLSSIHSFLTEVDTFKKVSGLRINTSKSSALLLGNTPKFKLPMSIKWTNEPIKVLGIYISNDLPRCFDLTIQESIIKMKQTLNAWRQRKLTLNGKVLILKSLILSKFIHIANLVPVPDDVLKEINQLCFEFLWNGKTHKVKRSVIVQDFPLGGYNMVDLKTLIEVQKLKWIKLYLNSHNCLWRNVMESLIHVENLTFFLLGNFDMTELWSRSLFYNDIIRILSGMNKINQLSTVNNIYHQKIFYNKYLKFANKLMFDNEFINAGIWTVSDLFDSNNKPIEFSILKQRVISDNEYLFWRSLITKIKNENKIS